MAFTAGDQDWEVGKLRTTVHVERPDDTLVTITLTMTLRDWKEMQQQLDGHVYPSWKVSGAISTAILKIAQRLEVDEVETCPRGRLQDRITCSVVLLLMVAAGIAWVVAR